jgi:integrase
MHGLLEAARFEELITSNPASRLPRGTLPPNKKVTETPPYIRNEAESLVSDVRIPFDRRVLYALAALTGQRIGEVIGRRWRDYDPSVEPLGVLFVHSQYDDQPLKTGNPRQVPVHPVLAKILAEWKLDGFAKYYGHHPLPDDFIVPNKEGGCRTYNQVDKAMRRDCDRIGVPLKGTHACRRFFITYARADGAREDVIERVTHNAKGTMVDQYTYFGWEVLCEAVLCLRFDVSRGEVIPLRKASSGGEQGAIYVESYDALLKTPIISSGGGGNRTLEEKRV